MIKVSSTKEKKQILKTRMQSPKWSGHSISKRERNPNAMHSGARDEQYRKLDDHGDEGQEVFGKKMMSFILGHFAFHNVQKCPKKAFFVYLQSTT